ncbi:radical SAM family heme chaperone HemW [Alicyclobacillaceae bacterium I2511]|nr:radical SAM family heme chaperone HemW [Alicyclobacillaceae bacterium I2511]
MCAYTQKSRVFADTLRNEAVSSLYVHIPFCAHRCYYCDFVTAIAPETVVEAYLSALACDLQSLALTSEVPLQTVFFGGGTPTYLSTQQLDEMLTHLHHRFRIADTAEMTMEANPESISPEKLKVLRDHQVTRLSLGVQTMQSRLLKNIGRLHDGKTVLNSIEMAAQSGFTHLSIDLIFGLPGQTLADVQSDLALVAQLPVDHVSAYWLQVEPGTPFARWQAAGKLNLPGEDTEADMYDEIRTSLQNIHLSQYEVSNFARPGAQSKHNLVYWHNEPYLAAGVGASSYAYGLRERREPRVKEYIRRITAGESPIIESQSVTAVVAAQDTMMLGLRLREGVGRQRFFVRHGVEMEAVFGTAIESLVAQGLLQWQGDQLSLTERAWPIANLVFAEFVEP